MKRISIVINYLPAFLLGLQALCCAKSNAGDPGIRGEGTILKTSYAIPRVNGHFSKFSLLDSQLVFQEMILDSAGITPVEGLLCLWKIGTDQIQRINLGRNDLRDIAFIMSIHADRDAIHTIDVNGWVKSYSWGLELLSHTRIRVPDTHTWIDGGTFLRHDAAFIFSVSSFDTTGVFQPLVQSTSKETRALDAGFHIPVYNNQFVDYPNLTCCLRDEELLVFPQFQKDYYLMDLQKRKKIRCYQLPSDMPVETSPLLNRMDFETTQPLGEVHRNAAYLWCSHWDDTMVVIHRERVSTKQVYTAYQMRKAHSHILSEIPLPLRRPQFVQSPYSQHLYVVEDDSLYQYQFVFSL